MSRTSRRLYVDTTYRCDNCGREQTITRDQDERNEPPPGWFTVPTFGLVEYQHAHARHCMEEMLERLTEETVGRHRAVEPAL